MNNETEVNIDLCDIETALMAAHVCIKNISPELMSFEETKTFALLMIDKALIIDIPKIRKTKAAGIS